MLQDLFPLREIHKHHLSLFSANSYSHLLAKRNETGLNDHLVWIGGRAFISDSKIEAWLESRPDAGKRGSSK